MSSSHDVVIKIEAVGKKYDLYARPQDRIKQMLLPRLQKSLGQPIKQYYAEHEALDGISLSVSKGETLGIIGHNGAGKSTLLQIICGTLQATTGEVKVSGRVAALLELGAGFNAEFSGRENVFLYGSILGLDSQEIHSRFDEIAEFSSIGEFMDRPVKTYSSGMYVRLAFAVAACIDPDILIIDEALAVGDVKFQAKCFRRFEELVARGTTILFVTHSTEQIVRHCDRAVLLHHGKIAFAGEPRDVSNRYLDLMFGVERQAETSPIENSQANVESEQQLLSLNYSDRPGYNPNEYRWGNQLASIGDFHVSQDNQTHETSLLSEKPIFILFSVKFTQSFENPIYGFTIKTPDGVTLYSSNSRDQLEGSLVSSVIAGESKVVKYTIENSLGTGDYLLSIGVAVDQHGEIIPLDRRFDSIHIKVVNKTQMVGFVDMKLKVEA